MGTNLHKIKFPMISRIQRIKSLIDRRKTQRSQVFLNHRFHHFLASNDQIRLQFHAICEHLDLICSYSVEQKFTAAILVLISQTPQSADFIRAAELNKHMSNELNGLLTSICNILNEITINYLVESKYDNGGVHFDCDIFTFRPNVNSISHLLGELLSLLLSTFSNRCKTTKMHMTKSIIDAFELCYQQFPHHQIIMQRNLRTILALTQGIGRFDRTKTIAEHGGHLMQQIMYSHINNSSESLIVLQIIHSMTGGFPENINNLLNLKLLDYLKTQMADTNQNPSYALVEECLCILENVCGNHRNDIQAVIDADLIAPLINVLRTEINDYTRNSRKIALNSLCNIAALGNIEQLRVLLDLDLLHLLCCQFNCRIDMNDEDIVETALDVMNNVLSDFYRKDHKTFHIALFHVINNEWNGYAAIEQLTNHTSETISNLAHQITEYNINYCEKCKKTSSHIMVE